MGRIIEFRGVKISDGLPKICVPILGETISNITDEAEFLKTLDFDVVEWRADFFRDVININSVREVLLTLRTILPQKPIIFTFRSAKEGGAREISTEFYLKLNSRIVETKLIDAVDIELFNDEKDIKRIVFTAHNNSILAIISNHDFVRTPSKEEIISRLLKASELGDIAKIAVMPTCARDIITLLEAACIMKENHPDIPIITIAMSGKGVISRISGELFESVMTFGSAKKSSAPGQIFAEDLRRIIQILHNNM